MARTGRRAGAGNTREAILAAARAAFAESGYNGATVRGIAAAAKVDPALIHHYFGTKEALFVAAMELPVDPAVELPRVLAGGLEDGGERIVRFFLGIWERPAARDRLLGMLRGAMTHEVAAAMLRGFVDRAVVSVVAKAIDRPDARLRATLIGSQLVGLAVVRYVVRLEPLASADPDKVVAALAPTIQRYLTGELDQSGERSGPTAPAH